MREQFRVTSCCDVADSGRENLYHFLPILLWRHVLSSSIMTLWMALVGEGWRKSMYSASSPGIAASPFSILSMGGDCGRSLMAGKILFTGRQTFSLYLVSWLCTMNLFCLIGITHIRLCQHRQYYLHQHFSYIRFFNRLNTPNTKHYKPICLYHLAIAPQLTYDFYSSFLRSIRQTKNICNIKIWELKE